MSVALLDVNLLLALAWPNHSHHALAIDWFAAARPEGFATCPLTEAGFVRVSLNPAVVGEAKSSAAVLDLLARLRSLPSHHFWPDDLDLPTALVGLAPIVGHRQVSDAYLLALAIRHGGRLATFDRGIAALAPQDREEAVETLSPSPGERG